MTRSTSAVSGGTLVAVLLAGCIVRDEGQGQGHPLYRNPEQPRKPRELAHLWGPIGEVDGRDVSHLGKSFELLPGCHIVKLAKKTGEISPRGGYVGNLPPLVYAFRMEGGHSYEIAIEVGPSSGPLLPMSVHAWDHDMDGGAIEESPVRSNIEIDHCQQWRP